MRYVIADVFTDRPFGGNQLAVFTDARDIPEEWLQQLTREFNFAETVFIFPSEGDAHARMRIFTPAAEIPFAGHPVLGTAFVLAGPLQLEQIVLETGVGNIPVTLEREGPRISFGWMEQPTPTVAAFGDARQLLDLLGAPEPELPVEIYNNGIEHVMVKLADLEAVRGLEPNMARLAKMPHVGTSCFAGSESEYTTRMFAPGYGVPEDPATGSAAGPLACHLVRHGLVEPGAELSISQGAQINRPSELTALAHGSPDAIERVVVGGSAVVVARGEFKLPPPA